MPVISLPAMRAGCEGVTRANLLPLARHLLRAAYHHVDARCVFLSVGQSLENKNSSLPAMGDGMTGIRFSHQGSVAAVRALCRYR